MFSVATASAPLAKVFRPRAATSIYETLARILTLIGVLAVGVAALGVYGLVAYTVKQRAQEIGIRTALGGTRGTIVGHFMRQGLMLSALGAALGVAMAVGVARLMTTLLFGIASSDVMSFAIATLVVIGSAVAASLVPAWRAATNDPIAALRRS